MDRTATSENRFRTCSRYSERRQRNPSKGHCGIALPKPQGLINPPKDLVLGGNKRKHAQSSVRLIHQECLKRAGKKRLLFKKRTSHPAHHHQHKQRALTPTFPTPKKSECPRPRVLCPRLSARFIHQRFPSPRANDPVDCRRAV